MNEEKAEEVPVIDWKKLLIKYMNFVGECEGVNFLREGGKHFTPEEMTALNWADGRDVEP
jgi:hypothetical protein